MRERDIEAYLVRRVQELGGEIRKVKWIGRRSAPDRLVMLPGIGLSDGIGWIEPRTIWVELKNPQTILTFPAGFRERAQHREHNRMRRLGQWVVVIGTIEQVEELLK